MSHPTARVLDIAGTARDQVNVAVEDGLAGGLTGVDADVKPRNRRIGCLERTALIVEETLESGSF